MKSKWVVKIMNCIYFYIIAWYVIILFPIWLPVWLAIKIYKWPLEEVKE